MACNTTITRAYSNMPCFNGLDSNTMLEQRLSYLHNNPVESGIVFKEEDYCYRLAIDYCDGQGLLNIELIE